MDQILKLFTQFAFLKLPRQIYFSTIEAGEGALLNGELQTPLFFGPS